MFLRGLRSYSTAVPVYTRPTFRQLLRQPVTKTLVLTGLFGSALVEMVHHKRRLNETTHQFNNKIELLEEIINKLEKNEPIDLERELRLANALTHTKEVDIEIDDDVENLFKQLTEEVTAAPEVTTPPTTTPATEAIVDATHATTATATPAAVAADAAVAAPTNTAPTPIDTTKVKFL